MKKAAISQVDTLFASGSYAIEFLFYFDKRLDTGPLREALKRISSSFWPVFGRFEGSSIVFERYREEDFFDEVSSHKEFALLQTEEERFRAYSLLRLPHLKKMLFIKALHFRNGTALLCKMNHLAGDGYSYFYLLSVLAALCQKKSRPIQTPLSQLLTRPHHHRTALRDFTFKGADTATSQQPERFKIEYVEFRRSELFSLLRDMSAQNLRLSTNDVLTATALKKIIDKRGSAFGKDVCLTIPIDVRRKIKAYGPRFFGNGILLHTTTYKKEEIEQSSTTQIAEQIRASMPPVSRESYSDYLAALEHLLFEEGPSQFRPFDPDNGCLVTNLSRLPTEKLNFGSGRPALVFPLTIEKHSAAVLSKEGNFILRIAY